jgi:FkbM family methyltransferase
MQPILTSQIARRNPFKIKQVPWIARVYAYPFNRWSSLGTQAVFGAPNFLFFLLCQKFSPFNPKGSFGYTINDVEQIIRFNALNTQFSALYLKNFEHGFESQTSALLDLLLPATGVFYDVGSNWGWFSLYLAAKPGFRGKIHAFEPFPSSYEDISSLIQQTGLAERIQAHNLALSDHAGTASISLPDHFQSGSATIQENTGRETGGTRTSALDLLDLEPPDLIKIDVEGMEAKVFKGGAKFLAKHKPMMVFENQCQPRNPWSTLEPLKFANDLGYDLFQMGWLRHHEGQNFLVTDDLDMGPQNVEMLTLLPLHLSTRFLHGGGMNIFACHRDRIAELKSHFKETDLENWRPAG